MFRTFHFMGHETHIPLPPLPRSGQDYAALRQTGTPARRAQLELGLANGQARRLEAGFRGKTARGAGDLQLPKFARHEEHVRAVMAQGGFCAFSEHRLGGGAIAACLPLVWPR